MTTCNIDRLLKALWIKACRWQHIPNRDIPSAKFVVFADDNPHIRRRDKILDLKWRASQLA